MDIELGLVQKHLDWLKQKLYLDTVAKSMTNRKVMRGQVYICDLGVGIGSEQTKKRPCLIIHNNNFSKSPNTTIVPITHTYKPFSCIIKIADRTDKDGNILLDGYVNVSAIRSVSKARLGEYVCSLTKDEMKKIDEELSAQLDLKHYYDKVNNILNDKLVYISKLSAIMEEVKKQTGAENNNEILEKLQILLDDLKK